ncbi:MAG TPA: hypothetical protein VH165_33295 [Kofleriaceae bacterium]|nr:hypothetical protein [Kofleriaceae bacterium]
MKRFLFVVAAISGLASVGACDKPTPDDCRLALENIQKLMGTASPDHSADSLATEIRSCRGGSSKESVQCATKANTLEELKACKFMAPRSDSKSDSKSDPKSDSKSDSKSAPKSDSK